MTKLKYSYRNGETPIERLRNKLQPIFLLVATAEVQTSNEGLKELGSMCVPILDEINDLLDDIGPFYKIESPKYEQSNTLE